MTVTTQMIEAVQAEQIGRCTKIFEGSQACYMVLSESDDLTEYKVRAIRVNRKWIFTCSCPSGAEGFANVKHPSGVCKHVRWSLAAAAEEKKAMAEQVALNEAAKVAKAIRPVVTITEDERLRFWAFRPEMMDQAEREAFATQHPDLVAEYIECWEEYLVK